jgi:HEAT repeat protein
MSLLEKAKKVVKEQKKETLSPMEQLLRDPEVKKAARYLAKHMPMTEARNKLNELLEEEGKLPVRKNGKVAKITYARFKELLPTPRKKKEA